jgi:hypothetical protein
LFVIGSCKAQTKEKPYPWQEGHDDEPQALPEHHVYRQNALGTKTNKRRFQTKAAHPRRKRPLNK